MTIQYFEGFDLHNGTIASGLDVGAIQDTGYYWSGGTSVFYGFVPGYLGGQAMDFDSAIKRAGYHGSFLTFRMGFWSRSQVSGGSMFLVAGTSVGGDWLVRINANGSLTLSYGGNVKQTSAPGTYNATWAHYEVWFSHQTGHAEVKKNGVLILSGDDTPSARLLTPQLGDAQFPSATWHPEYDHLYITDGPALTTDAIQAVSVTAAQERYEGLNGVRGTVMIGGLRYVTDWKRAPISSLSGGANFGRNVANVTQFLFPINPGTSLPWSQTGLDSIESWGLCFQEQSPATINDKVRVAGVMLSYLEYNSGMPLVKNRPAGVVTQFSGNWVKSDPALSYSAHIVNIPRPPVPLVANATSLFVSGVGCILFQHLEGGVEPPALLKVGLTFAEEFREDYRDWVKIDGVGVSFDSMFASGYSVLGEGNKKFQDNFVTVNYKNVPTGSCYIQGLWDYANNADSGRWSMRQVIDNRGGDYTHAHRRLKIRGHGKAMQLRVTNKGDTPFVINGWSMFITGNATV